MPTPRFQPITIQRALYDAVCEAVNQDFADSYLTGAEMNGRKLTPRTLTGYQKMRDVRAFMDMLEKANIELVRPTPWPGTEGNTLRAQRITPAYH